MWRILLNILIAVGALMPEPAFARDVVSDNTTETGDRFDDLDFDFPMERGTSPKTPRPPRIVFSRYRLDMGRMCNIVREDGRQEYLHQLLSDHAAPDEDCIACEKFFRTFASACKPKRQKRRKAEEDAAAPTLVIHKQREPRLELVLRTSQLFTRMAEDRHQAEIAEAVHRLANILQTDTIQTPAERDYFHLLASAMSAPFQEQESNGRDSSTPNVHLEKAVSAPNVNDLFE